MSDQLAIDQYCKYRDANPLDWEEIVPTPVFDNTDFANDIGTATFILEEIR